MRIFNKNQNWIKKRNIFVILLAWFSLAWAWILYTDSLKLSGSPTQGQAIATLVILINANASALLMFTVMNIARRLYNKYNRLLVILVLLCIFALGDFIVAWVTSFIWIGRQGSIDSILPLGSPVLILIHTPFAYASRLVGFHGLAAFAWLGFFLIAEKQYSKKIFYLVATLALLSIIGKLYYQHPSGKTTKVTIINESYYNRLGPISSKNTDLILFPEYGLDGVTPENISSRIMLADNRSTKYIGSQQNRTINSSDHTNVLVYGDTGTGKVQLQEKHRLIPGGEDMPYAIEALLSLTRQKTTLRYFAYTKQIHKSPYQLRPLVLNENSIIGAAVCSSIISPEDYRRLSLSGASILTNSASLGIFGGSTTFQFQQKALAKFMAIANARYFLQSANDARSYVLDINGNTISQVTKPEALRVTVRNNHIKTLYTNLGDWLVVIGGLLAIPALIDIYFSKRKPARTNQPQ